MLRGSAWAMAGHDKDTLPLSTAEILTLPWALQGYCGVGHCRDTLLLALQECSAVAVGQCRETVLLLGTAGILGWALQGYSPVGHCWDTPQLGTARILCGWALQGYLVVRHCRDPLWVGISGMITQLLVTAGIFGGWALQ